MPGKFSNLSKCHHLTLFGKMFNFKCSFIRISKLLKSFPKNVNSVNFNIKNKLVFHRIDKFLTIYLDVKLFMALRAYFQVTILALLIFKLPFF